MCTIQNRNQTPHRYSLSFLEIIDGKDEGIWCKINLHLRLPPDRFYDKINILFTVPYLLIPVQNPTIH